MIDSINANITHSFFYTAQFASANDFAQRIKKLWPGALEYSLNAEAKHPYQAEMQKAERFLHGGGQTYEVKRFFFTDGPPDMEKSGFVGWCTMFSYFTESDILAISFHYTVHDATTDRLIGLRQSGNSTKLTFRQGDYSCIELAQKVCELLGIKAEEAEKSFLCEITKFGDYTSIEEIEEKEAARLYGFISGDEGYDFVPMDLIRDRLGSTWSSREFIKIYAIGKSFLFLNILNGPSHERYLDRQIQFGTDTYGGTDPYFFMGECPLTVNHGIFFSVEFVMMLKVLINEVLVFQTEFGKNKKMSYYKRIAMTRQFRRKIILVLEKVENTAIAEIGQLSAILLESQHIAPVVDQVKYLLELLEADLDLTYSEHNNWLMTILTVLGLLLAVWQVILAL